MNREERRSLKKQGASEETIDKLGVFSSNCTITEAVQIARATAEDVLAEYHNNQINVQLAMSMQIEILKEVMFNSGMISEDEFKVKYLQRVKEIQEAQKHKEDLDNSDDVTTAAMKVEAGDIEIDQES